MLNTFLCTLNKNRTGKLTFQLLFMKKIKATGEGWGHTSLTSIKKHSIYGCNKQI